jgi:hypothetical protein
MTIGLDYDGVVTEDPVLWAGFIAMARERGHKVYCVTCRQETLENVEECDVPGVLTIFTGGAPKDWFCRERGVVVTVWIDDCPDCVLHGR